MNEGNKAVKPSSPRFFCVLARRLFLDECGPAVFGPDDAALHQDGGSAFVDGITMADEEVGVAKMVGGGMACGLKLFLVALEDYRSTSLGQVFSCGIEIGTIHLLAPAHGHTVGALHASAAEIEGDEEVIIASVPENEGGLDGIHAWLRLQGGTETCGYHFLLAGPGKVQRGIETGQLDAAPERAPGHPWLVVLIDDDVGVDGVPIVAQAL